MCVCARMCVCGGDSSIALGRKPAYSLLETKFIGVGALLKVNTYSQQTKVREMAYNTLVRPQLEYASLVWDPYIIGKILQIEKVERRAARWTSNNSDPRSSVTGMLDEFGWCTPEQRRAGARLCLFYKIVWQSPCQIISSTTLVFLVIFTQ